MHLIIPYAASDRLGHKALDRLALPALHTWLGQSRCSTQDTDPGHAPSPSAMPHERALARALGWTAAPPYPWAAWQTDTPGMQAQAWITPCHWQIGMNQAVMLNPQDLQLSNEESQQLLQAMQPFLQEDGLTVRWHSALQWHASGDAFDGLETASLDRVIDADINAWLTGQIPASLRRLQSEMQMLLYNHPVNDARLARGQWTINSFWVHGAGKPPAASHADARLIHDLREPALQGDMASWRATWQGVDTLLAGMLHLTNSITLCSERAAHTYTAAPRGWRQRITRLFQTTDTSTALQALLMP